MKTTKFFLMAALALTFAACSNDDNDILNPAQTAKAEGITITATLAPKDAGATTRAVNEGTGVDAGNIVTSWAVNEHIAILYDKDGAQMADATITSVDANGVATISFTVASGTADNTACTLVYPYSAAKDDKSGVKDAATLLAAQNGTLNANLDVRVGAGKIKTSTPGLDVTTQPAAQFAIFKFTVKNSDASATIDVKPLTITIGTQDYVITPSSATSTLYAALPAVSGQTVSFSATGSDSKTYTFSKDGVTFAAGNFYQSTLKMAAAGPTAYTLAESTVGMIVGTDGKAYAVADKDNLPSGVTAVAMVAYKSGSNGLAIQLNSSPDKKNWAQANTYVEGLDEVSGGTWRLPSKADWQNMFVGCAVSGDATVPDANNQMKPIAGFKAKIAATGITWNSSVNYWASTESGSMMWLVGVNLGDSSTLAAFMEFPISIPMSLYVRACLAF